VAKSGDPGGGSVDCTMSATCVADLCDNFKMAKTLGGIAATMRSNASIMTARSSASLMSLQFQAVVTSSARWGAVGRRENS